MSYTLTEHAKKVLAEREIPLEWLERTLNEPLLRAPDPDDASLERRYRSCCAWLSTSRLNRPGW